MLLALVISTVLALALAALIVLEFLQVLPLGLSAIMIMSLLVAVVAIGKAVLERTLALPNTSRRLTPVVRHGGR